MDNDSLPLSDVLSRVTIQVHEAVALVRAVADCLLASPGRGMPELDAIDLAPDGSVRLNGTALQGDPVKRLGQLLHAALLQADAPVQLRLRATEATGPTPVFTSAAEFSHALAYFERPNRELVLRGVYERAIAAPRTQPTASTLDRLAPLPEREIERKRSPARRRIDRRAVTGMTVVAAVVFALVAYTQFSAAGEKGIEVSGASEKASGGVAAAMLGGISSLTEAAGLGRLVSTGGQANEALPTPAASGVSKRISDTTRGGAASRRRPTASRELLSVQHLARSTAGALMLLPTVPSVQLPETRSPETTDFRTIYSEEDTEVTPPVGIRPQFPTVVPGQTRHLSQIEVVVTPEGSVASVKLVGEPKTVLDSMLLSAAKAWIFTPAMKDGQPVKYRKAVWLAIR